MGKNSKKITKNQQTQRIVEEKMKMEISKKNLEEMIEQGEYEKGLEQIVRLLESGHTTDSFILFAAAEFYFQAGDYERAAQWIDNTLAMEPASIEARLLLANICLLQDRVDDSFKIYEFLLENDERRLSQKNGQDIKNKLEYYIKIERLKLENEYPILAKFLGIDSIEKSSDEQPENATVTVSQKIEKESLEESFDVEKTKQEILQKETDLKTKIALCNSFAGACFFKQKLTEAEEFLTMALSFDGHHKETLRNYVYLALEQKDKEKALSYAAKMEETDFSLLQQIRNAN